MYWPSLDAIKMLSRFQKRSGASTSCQYYFGDLLTTRQLLIIFIEWDKACYEAYSFVSVVIRGKKILSSISGLHKFINLSCLMQLC